MVDDGHPRSMVEDCQRSLADLDAAVRDGDEGAASGAGTSLLYCLSELRARVRGTVGENALSWIPAYVEVGEDTGYRNSDLVMHTASWVFAVTDMERWMRGATERARSFGARDDLGSPGDILAELFEREMAWPGSRYEDMGLATERVDQATLDLHLEAGD